MDYSDDIRQQAQEVRQTAKLLNAVLKHNHVTFNVAMASLAWVLARACHAQGLSEFDAINKFVTTVKETYRQENDPRKES